MNASALAWMLLARDPGALDFVARTLLLPAPEEVAEQMLTTDTAPWADIFTQPENRPYGHQYN